MATLDIRTQGSCGTAMPGTWQLKPGHAMGLRTRQASRLELVHGGLWVTLEGEYGLSPDRCGDLFLRAGDQLLVPAGQRLVMEPYGGPADGAASFRWDPVTQTAAPSLAAGAHWRVGVVQPLADLRAAGVLGLGAAARLVLGLVVWAGAALRRRGDAGLAACACSAQSSA